MSATVTFEIDDEVEVIEVEGPHLPGWAFRSGEVTVSFTNDAWCVIDSLQDWLHECPKCGGSFSAPPQERG